MNKNKEGNRSYLGAIFGLVFVLAGSWAVYSTAGKMSTTYFKSQDWHVVPATIIDLELQRNTSSDSITYTVIGEYVYQYQGQEFMGSNISTSSGSDNIGSYWQDLYAVLMQKRRSDTVEVWVNPRNPSESVLDRSFRWPMIGFASIFLVLFCGLGAVVAWFSWKKSLSPSRIQQQALTADGGILSNEKSGGWFLFWFGSVFFLVGTVMGVMILPEELAKENYPALLILIFSFAGAGIMTAAIKSILAYRRFGPTPLCLDPEAPGIGGQLGAYFHLKSIRASQVSSTPLAAKLRCVQKYRSGDDTRSRTVWSDETAAYAFSERSGVRVVVLFDIPETEKPTHRISASEEVYWEVSVAADFSAVGMGKFDRSWRVFMAEQALSPQSSLRVPEHLRRQAEHESQEKATESALIQINLTDESGILTLHSSAGRGFLMSLMAVLFGGIFAGAGWFTVNQDWWPGYVFLLIGGGIMLASVFSMGSSVKANFDKMSRSFSVTRRWFGLPFSTKKGDLTDATQFSIKQTMSTDDGRDRVEYFDLYTLSGGRKFKVAERIKGRRAANALKEKLIERLF